MFRIDTTTNTNSLSAPSPARTPGYFQSGNPQTGIPATVPDTDWFNTVQEEIASLVEHYGLALNKTDHTQMRQAIEAAIAANAPTGGGLIGFHVFTSSGTYNKNPDARAIKITVIGGGASGAKAHKGNSATGGGAGGASIKFIDNTIIGSMEVITIGVGGAAPVSAGDNGNNGGTSSFGSFCSATGGTNGRTTGGDCGGSAGGIGIGGDINIKGGPSDSINDTDTNIATAGGSSILSGGSAPYSGEGSHGSGSGGVDYSKQCHKGGDGIIVVEEYA